MIKKYITVTESRKKIFQIIKEVQKPNTVYYLTIKGIPQAAIISVDEFEGLLETIEVLSEYPDIKKDLEEIKKDCQKGEFAPFTKIAPLKNPFFMDKKTKYGVSNLHRKKNKKRTK